jgi:hypothetical protein
LPTIPRAASVQRLAASGPTVSAVLRMGWGAVKSLARWAGGPVNLNRTENFGIKWKKPT